MLDKIPFRFAVNTLLLLFLASLIFHLLVLSGVIPYQIVWGGRLQTAEQMVLFESISVLLTLLLLLVLASKGAYLRPLLPPRVITIILWCMVLLFALNTLGNLLAESSMETLLFTPLTLLSSLLFWRLAIE